MITLGLDPSLSGFGWCVHNTLATGPDRVIARGKFVTSPKTAFVRRYMDLRGSVADLLTKYQPEAVGVESPPFGELWSEGLYGLFLYVNEALYTGRRDVVFFDPGTLKMLVKVDHKARPGKMFKADMVEAAKMDTATTKVKWDHNEADAYHIARFAGRFWHLYREDIATEDLTPSEYQAFAQVYTFKRGAKAGLQDFKGALYKEGSRFHRYSQIEPLPKPRDNLWLQRRSLPLAAGLLRSPLLFVVWWRSRVTG